MIALGAVDAATVAAIGVMIVGVVTAIVAPLSSRRKNHAETESIATRTTLEVNEDLRTEIQALRERHAEELEIRDERIERLEGQLEARDKRIETLEERVATLRRDVEGLEAEIAGLRDGPPQSR